MSDIATALNRLHYNLSSTQLTPERLRSTGQLHAADIMSAVPALLACVEALAEFRKVDTLHLDSGVLKLFDARLASVAESLP